MKKICYLVLINLLTFAAYGIDKRKAQKRLAYQRVYAAALAAAGGSVGALLGMQIFRHKTKHPKFTVGVPLILLVQIGLAVWWVLH